ncbi:hypothetical protein Dimus_004250 [Dionaea muscipula]
MIVERITRNTENTTAHLPPSLMLQRTLSAISAFDFSAQCRYTQSLLPQSNTPTRKRIEIPNRRNRERREASSKHTTPHREEEPKRRRRGGEEARRKGFSEFIEKP